MKKLIGSFGAATLAVLALAALRTWQLLANDAVLACPRSMLVGALGGVSEPLRFARPLLEKWLSCPFCSGLWISAGWYAAWLLEPRWSLYAAAPLAISAAVGLSARLLPD